MYSNTTADVTGVISYEPKVCASVDVVTSHDKKIVSKKKGLKKTKSIVSKPVDTHCQNQSRRLSESGRFSVSFSEYYRLLKKTNLATRRIREMSNKQLSVFFSGDQDGRDSEDLCSAMQALENELWNTRVIQLFSLLSDQHTSQNQEAESSSELNDDYLSDELSDEFPMLLNVTGNEPTIPHHEESNIKALSHLPQAVTHRTQGRLTAKKTRCVYRECDLSMPPTLGKIFDAILALVNKQRHQTGYQQDITACCSLLSEGDNEGRMEFIRALVLPENIHKGCDLFYQLQQQNDPEESRITASQFADLKGYLMDEVFNNKKVGFSFNDLKDWCILGRKRQPVLETLPPALGKLLSFAFESTLTLRMLEGTPVKKRNFIQQMQHSDQGILVLDLLGAFSQTPPHYQQIREVQSKLMLAGDSDPVTSNDLNEPSSKEPGQEVISVVTDMENREYHEWLNELKHFLDQHFFKPWLLAFKPDELSRSKRKPDLSGIKTARRSQEKRARGHDDYYYDPAYHPKKAKGRLL